MKHKSLLDSLLLLFVFLCIGCSFTYTNTKFFTVSAANAQYQGASADIITQLNSTGNIAVKVWSK